jgi:hypothetical protein
MFFLVPLVGRNLYPADQYPDGQWDYYRFYLTHFDQSVSDMEADIPSTWHRCIGLETPRLRQPQVRSHRPP